MLVSNWSINNLSFNQAIVTVTYFPKRHTEEKQLRSKGKSIVKLMHSIKYYMVILYIYVKHTLLKNCDRICFIHCHYENGENNTY